MSTWARGACCLRYLVEQCFFFHYATDLCGTDKRMRRAPLAHVFVGEGLGVRAAAGENEYIQREVICDQILSEGPKLSSPSLTLRAYTPPEILLDPLRVQ